jgi:hypothetical protein
MEDTGPPQYYENTLSPLPINTETLAKSFQELRDAVYVGSELVYGQWSTSIRRNSIESTSNLILQVSPLHSCALTTNLLYLQTPVNLRQIFVTSLRNEFFRVSPIVLSCRLAYPQLGLSLP